MSKPAMMVVNESPAELAVVEQELRKRYGADYDVCCEVAAEAALRWLAALKQAGQPVALLLTDGV